MMAPTALDLPLCKMSKLDKRSLWEILSVEKFDLRDGENGEERERDLKCVSVELTNSNKNLAIFLAGWLAPQSTATMDWHCCYSSLYFIAGMDPNKMEKFSFVYPTDRG